MTNPIAFLILCFISWDNLSQEPTTENLIDWDMLTVVRTCTVNKKYCDDKLSIDNALRAKIQVCGQKARNLTIDKAELQKITNVNKAKIKQWIDDYHVDSVCGYLIKLDNSTTDHVFFDSNPENYESDEIKEYIQALNKVYKKIR